MANGKMAKQQKTDQKPRNTRNTRKKILTEDHEENEERPERIRHRGLAFAQKIRPGEMAGMFFCLGLGIKLSSGLDAFPFPISGLTSVIKSYRQGTWQALS